MSVQLLAHKAKAYARMGDPRQSETALETGRQVMEALPYPDDISNHFAIEPAKWDFYVMDCYRITGQNDLARTYAEGVIHSGTDPSGHEWAPMRNAEARLTLGVVAAREGDPQEAADLGVQALSGGRQSAPSLLLVGRELEGELTRAFPREASTVDFTAHLRELRARHVS